MIFKYICDKSLKKEKKNMTKSQIFRGNEYSKILVLIFLIILSCTFLIYINHSTIRILQGLGLMLMVSLIIQRLKKTLLVI